MPVQTKMASLAGKLGGRLAAANAEAKDKPIETGFKRLPPGIRNGIARIQAMKWVTQTKDNGKVPKGELYFQGTAVVVSPVEFNGEKIEGQQTSIFIPLCDTPAKGDRKATTFADNYFEFQNLMRLLNIPACQETTATDPTGTKTEAYWIAAMQQLTDPKKPCYLAFSTRSWTPDPKPGTPKDAPPPEPMFFEDWNGRAEWDGKPDPKAGITVAASQPDHMDPPPVPGALAVDGLPMNPNEVLPNLADEVNAFVAIALSDPEGVTEDGRNAARWLEETAWQAGWSEEDTNGAENWAAVGEMILADPNEEKPADIPVTVGSKWNFASRGPRGDWLKDGDGKDLPTREVEVTSVDEATKTCTVKTTKDGKDIVNARSKKPIAVKFEWLE